MADEPQEGQEIDGAPTVLTSRKARGRISRSDLEHALEFYDSKVQIAESLGVCLETIYNYVRRYGLDGSYIRRQSPREPIPEIHPVSPATALHICWAAGFLEGEGSFNIHRTTPSVTAPQVQREPLVRLASYLGGKIRQRGRPRHGINASPIYVWVATGSRAVAIMMTLYPLMSPKRRGQIDATLQAWRALGVANHHKPFCPRGHVYRNYRNIRICDVCRADSRVTRSAVA